MKEYIKRQTDKMVEMVKEFEMKDYFSLNYKETGKFNFTIFAIAGLLCATNYFLGRYLESRATKTAEIIDAEVVKG